MKSIRVLIGFAALLLLAGGPSAYGDEAAPPVRIMPLGDSITLGCCSGSPVEGGYRTRLHSLLTAAGFNVDFVGTRKDLNNPELPDVDHQGEGGYQIEGVRAEVNGWLKEVEDPDVILLHLGTNDISAGRTVPQTQESLKSLIAELSGARPFAKIIVSSLLPRTDGAAVEAASSAFNQALPALVGEQVSLGRPVTYLDMTAAIEPADLNDGIHPNPAGYGKMADAWLPAVTAVITPLGTSVPPAIARLDARTDLNHLTVRFSKPVGDAAATPGFFTLNGGVAVLAASLDPVSKRVVTLTTDAQSPGTLYTLAVTGVRDRTPEQNLILPNATLEFTSRTLIDGSFEADGQGWALSGSNQVVGSPLPATDGTKLMVFNGMQSATDGVISQVIPTIPGKEYKLDFDMGVNGSNAAQALTVQVNGNFPLLSETEQLAGPGGGATRWASQSFGFVANSEMTTLRFEDASSTTTNVDLLLDDVRMNQVVTPVLKVKSSPDLGVGVTVSPADLGSAGNGSTNFTRTYSEGQMVNLTAPATSGGLNFEKWQKNGLDHSFSPATSVTMNANHTLKAVYSILTNGGFETGADLGGNVTAVNPWTTSGPVVFGYIGDSTYVPSEGSRLLVFNDGAATPSGSVSQSFPTVSGRRYLLEFDMKVQGAVQQQVQVTVNGATPRLSVPDTAPGNGQWHPKSHEFGADSTTTTLTFADASATAQNVDLLLDHVRIYLIEENTAPVAVDDSYAVTRDVPLVVAASGVLANDTDEQFNPLTAVVDAMPTHGTVNLNANGGFTYTPATNYTGTDTFTYHASDGFLNSNVATVSLTITAPVSQLLVNGSFEQGSAPVNSVVADVTGWTRAGNQFGYESTGAYMDTDGDKLMVFNGGTSTPDGEIYQTFTTTPGQAYLLEFDMGVVGVANAVQQFLVTVTGTGNLLSQVDSAQGNGVNQSSWSAKSHVFVANSASTTLKFTDISANIQFADLLLDNVRVTPGSARGLTVTSSPANGAAVTVSPLDLNGNQNGTTSFVRYFANNAVVDLIAPATLSGNGFLKWRKNGVDFSNNLTVSVTMDANHALEAVYNSVNLSPVAVADAYSVTQDTPLVVPAAGVLANDSDPESATLFAVQNTGPAHGSLTLNPNGGFTYTPTAGYTGPDSFTYHANDGTFNSDVVTVSITVNPVGANLLVNGSFEDDTNGWTTTGGNPFAYTQDGSYVATDPVKLLVFNGGVFTPGGEIHQTFATTPGQTYSLTFDMGVLGATGVTQRLRVLVEGATTLVDVPDTAVRNNGDPSSAWTTKTHSFVADSISTTLTFTDTSTTGASVDLLLDHVRVVANANRTLTVTSSAVTGVSVAVSPPDLTASANGTTDFTRTYADGEVVTLTAPSTSGAGTFVKWRKNGVDETTNAAVIVTMNAAHTLNAVYFVNSPPVAVADSYTATRNVQLNVASPGVLANDSDPDTNPLTAILNVGPAHGSLSLNTNGGFTYTPDPGYLGADSFTYHAHDGGLSSAVTTVALTVVAPNSLANGSFEQGTTGWNVAGNQGVATTSAPYFATDGSKLMVFHGGPSIPNAVIYQSFPTTQGQPYKLELDMGILAYNNSQQLLGVAVQGASSLVSQTISAFGNGAGNSAYQTYTFTFVADSASTTLTLTDLSALTDQVDLLLDNVRVTEGTVRTLTVSSPVSGGAAIQVSPLDLGGNGNGTTGFTRSYIAGTVVGLTAQAVAGGGNFLKWRKNGVDYAATAATSVTLDENATLAAIYSPNAAPLAVADSYSVNEDAVLTVPAAGVLSNDSDPESGPFTAVLGAGASHGSLTLSPDGGFIYTPFANYNGPDSFAYHADDGDLDSNVVTVSITVVPVNDPPSAQPQSLTLDEDTPTPFTPAGADPIDLSPVTFAIVDPPLRGTISGASPNFTYTPAANYNGGDSFTYVANDGTENSAPALVSITIAPVADIPVAVAQSVSMTGATTQSLVLAGSDPDGGAVTLFIKLSDPLHGTLSGAIPNLVYTPAVNYEGTDSFTFKVNDGTSDSLPATVSITVNGILKNGSFEQTTTVGPAQIADFWTASAWTDGPTPHYSVKPAGGGYTPNDLAKLAVFNDNNGSPNAVLSQTFATTPGQPYVLSFDLGAFGVASQQKMRVTLTGGSLNQTQDETINGPGTLTSTWSPRTIPFTAKSATTTLEFSDRSSTSSVVDLLLDKVKVTALVTHVLTVASNPDPGVNVTVSPLDIEGGGNGVTGFTRRYLDGAVVNLAAPVAIGATNFQKWQKDGVDLTTSASTSVTMGAAHTLTAFYIPNAPPVALADSYSTNEDVPLVVPAAGVLANDTDPESKPMTAVVDASTAHGNLVLNANGGFTYTPVSNYSGPDMFTYHASDGVVNSSTVTVTLTVNPVNDAPVAASDSYSTAEDAALVIPAAGVLANDTDIDSGTLTAAVNVLPAHGTLTLGTNGGFTYNPAANYSGPDSFTYHANDTAADSNIATVSITVTAVNDAPVAVADSYSTAEDTALVIPAAGVLANDTDIDSGTLTGMVNVLPAHGTLTLGTNGGFTYTPAANYSGPDSFTYHANDSSADSNIATVSITVTAVNDAPVAVADSYSTAEDTALVIPAAGVLVNDTDIDSGTLTGIVNVLPAHGTLSLGTNGGFTYTPAANYSGPDSFTYHANDSSADSNIATVSITVTPVDDGGFAEWMIGLGISGNPGDDFDRDSVSNVIEYVIGGDPEDPSDASLLPDISLVTADPDNNSTAEDYVLFTFRRTDLADSDANTSIDVDWNTGLTGAWTDIAVTSGVETVVSNNEAGPGVDVVRVYIPRTHSLNGALFARLRVLVTAP